MDDGTTLNVTLTAYRCFFGKKSVSIKLEKGQCIAIVGKNNVGKSALMRFFYELRYLLVDFASGSWGNDGKYEVTKFGNSPNLNGVHGLYGISDSAQLFPNHDSNASISFSFAYPGVECDFSISKNGTEYTVKKQLLRTNGPPPDAILQTLFRNTLYIGAHRNVVNQTAGGGGYYDLSVGSAFVADWDTLKNGADIEKARLAKRAEDIVRDLLGWESIAINKSTDGTQLYASTNKSRFALTELGTGVSELILCVITAAIKKPSWIFIDEPESHLHPALQVKFLSALEQLASCGVVFTTHSIGLARAAADSIYVMQQDKDSSSELRPFEAAKNYSELLGELQFSQFHELGFDKILLCEGVTEIKTLRQFLRLWGLDSTVMLVPLGGSALIDAKRVDELSEFNRFGAKIFVLVDSERTNAESSSTQRSKFVTECEKLFGTGHAMQTERRAIENYFPQRAINVAMRSEKYCKLEEFENSENLKPFWGKNNNWRIASEVTREELSGTDIDRFFKKIATEKG